MMSAIDERGWKAKDISPVKCVFFVCALPSGGSCPMNEEQPPICINPTGALNYRYARTQERSFPPEVTMARPTEKFPRCSHRPRNGIALGSITLLETRSWPPLLKQDSSDLANMPPVEGESAFTRLPARKHPTEPSAKPSTAVPNSKPKTASSFRERLFLGAKKASPVKTKTSAASVQKKPHRKTSIGPIFKLNHTAAFQDGPSLHTWREDSSDVEPDVLIKELKSRSRGTPGFAVLSQMARADLPPPEHYQENAETLQKKATTQLQQTHSDLSHKLSNTLKGEAAFLATIETKNRTLCAPLSQEEIRFDEYGPADGEVRNIRKVVGKLVADVETKLSKVEADIEQLWAEWEVAEAEVARVYHETVPDQDGQNGTNDDTANFTDTLATFRTAINKEIEDAEAEVDQLSEAAVAMVKDIEKVSPSCWELGTPSKLMLPGLSQDNTPPSPCFLPVHR